MDKNGPTLTYYVYMLRCSDGSYYVGHTNDLEQRLAAHERGAIEGYTLSRRPVELVFSDQFSTRQEAFHRERQIKGWSRAKKEALIKSDWDGLVNYPTEVVEGPSFDRPSFDRPSFDRPSFDRPSFDRLRMKGKRFRMKVLVDEDGSKIKMRLPCVRRPFT